MKASEKAYALFVQKFSNFLEAAATPLVYTRNKAVTREKNHHYGQTKGTVCDFFYKTEASKPYPIFIYIHGGGWVSGRKDTRKTYCLAMADKGYFVMNTHYDLAPQVQYPTQIQQLFDAISYLFDNAEKYNLDTSRVVVGGESAGAYFTAYVAAIATNPSLYDEIGIKFAYRDSFRITATILLNGCYDFTALTEIKFLNMKTFLKSFFDMSIEELVNPANAEKTKYFSPMPFVSAQFPPTVVGRGTGDGLDKESVAFMEKLKALGVPHTSFMATGLVGVHGFCIAVNWKEGRRCFEETISFLDNYVK